MARSIIYNPIFSLMILLNLIQTTASAQKFDSGKRNLLTEKKWTRLYKQVVPENFVLMSGGVITNLPFIDYSISNSDTAVLSNAFSVNKNKVNINPYAISKNEVTNIEYLKFVQWVVDSIALTIMAQKDSSYYLSPNTKELNWSKRKLVQDSAIFPYLFPLYSYVKNPRGNETGSYKVDPSSVIYAFRKNSAVAPSVFPIYPDTLVWYRDVFSVYNDQMKNKYFYHPAFGDFPVVGVNWHQAIAYCDWLSRDGYFEYRLPTSAEFQMAYYSSTYFFNTIPTLKRSSRAGEFINNQHEYPWGHYQLFNKEGQYLANFGRIVDRNNLVIKDYASDGSIFPVKSGSYSPSLSGLYDLAGNVSEWVSDTVHNYYILTPQKNSTAFKRKKTGDSIFWEKSSLDVSKNEGIVLSSADSFSTIIEKLLQYEMSSFLSDYYERLQKSWNLLGKPTTLPQVSYIRPSNTLLAINEDSAQYSHDWMESTSYDELKEFLSYASCYYRNLQLVSSLNEPKMVMGGSWSDGPLLMSYGIKQVFDAAANSNKIGFRLAADVKLSPRIETYMNEIKNNGKSSQEKSASTRSDSTKK